MAEKRKDSKGRVLRTGESQRKDGSYMFRYTDKFGKRQTIYAPSLNDLRSKEALIAAKKVYGAETQANDITVDDLIERYTKLYRHRRSNTKQSYAFCEKVLLKSHLAKMKIKEVQTSSIKAWLVDLHQEGYSANTIYQIGRYVGRVFEVAVEDNLIFKNPAKFSFNFLDEKKHERRPLTEKEQQSLLKFTASVQKFGYMHDQILVLLRTGIRVGELMGITVNDLNFDDKTISINKQLLHYYRGEPKIGPTKTDSGNRVIPMSDEVCDALKRMVQRQKHYKVTQFIDGCTGFIVLDSKGRLSSAAKFNAVMRTIVKQHNASNELQLPSITAHIFRHTFATDMANCGLPPTALQYVMGHSSASMTFDVYSHSDRDVAVEATRKMFKAAFS